MAEKGYVRRAILGAKFECVVGQQLTGTTLAPNLHVEDLQKLDSHIDTAETTNSLFPTQKMKYFSTRGDEQELSFEDVRIHSIIDRNPLNDF